jgi:hypothetical protein
MKIRQRVRDRMNDIHGSVYTAGRTDMQPGPVEGFTPEPNA